MCTLTSLLEEYKRIAIVGICKNAGKTTVLNYLVESYHSRFKLGITSIGYDGEEKDAVTGLKKPKVFVYKDMLVATAFECIQKSNVEYEVVANTKIHTVLGKILLISIKSDGVIEISGPSIGSQMKDVCDMMERYGCRKILIDGAAGRKTHVVNSYSDCMVLSVGAALSNDMNNVIRKTSFLVELMSMKRFTCLEVLKSSKELNQKSAYYNVRGHNTKSGAYDDYYNAENHDVVYCIFSGAVVDSDIAQIMKQYRKTKKVVIVDNPTSLFISDRQLHRLLSQNGSIKVKTSINMVAVTINPMSPYDKWFDEDEFLDRMQNTINLPVFNVMK